MKEWDQGVKEGEVRHLEIGLGPVTVNWAAEHRDFVPGEQFVDEQVSGPFQSWVHRHLFSEQGQDECILTDQIEYRFPLNLPFGFALKPKLEKGFRFRHRQILRDLKVVSRFPSPLIEGSTPMTVGVTGSSGLVGSALCGLLEVAGHRVVRLQRGHQVSDSRGALWWPEPNLDALEGLDAVVHLAGETVAQPWTRGARERIFFSRAEGTKRLSEALARLKSPPKVLLSTSATGYYQQDGSEPVDEQDPPGDGFLSDVCIAWERGTEAAEEAGIRVCQVRVGLVLSSGGGMLVPQLKAFQLGLGAVLGDGEQVQPIIDLDDLVAAIYHLLNRDDLSGPFNATAPQQPSQKTFARSLAGALSRPLLLTVPEAPVRALIGDQADMLFRGVRALPRALTESGFEFLSLGLEDSLKHQLSLP